MSDWHAVCNILTYYWFCDHFRNLESIKDREICCYSISCKEKDNIGKWYTMIHSLMTWVTKNEGIIFRIIEEMFSFMIVNGLIMTPLSFKPKAWGELKIYFGYTVCIFAAHLLAAFNVEQPITLNQFIKLIPASFWFCYCPGLLNPVWVCKNENYSLLVIVVWYS